MQRVVFNGERWRTIGAGVAQGSLLGPLLFLLYINDIIHVVSDCNIRLFGNDTCLYIKVEDRGETARLVNNDVTVIS